MAGSFFDDVLSPAKYLRWCRLPVTSIGNRRFGWARLFVLSAFFFCVRGTSMSFFDYVAGNSPVQPLALRRVDIFGLHNDWCANLVLLGRVHIECKNKAP